MPTRMRLQRHGKKGKPFYHIVIADGRAPRDGRFIEKIGTYDPIPNPAEIILNADKALDWIQKGAQPSDTVRAILSYKGVLYKNHLLKGVAKGALSQAEADVKYQKWLQDKEAKIDSKRKGLDEEDRTSRKERLANEAKVNEARAAEIAKMRADQIEEQVREAKKAAAETVEEVEAEVTTEESFTKEAVEAKVEELKTPEAPKETTEKVEEEVKTEPEAKVEEAVKEEVAVEEKVEEVKKEAPEAKAEESNEEEAKKEDKKAEKE